MPEKVKRANPTKRKRVKESQETQVILSQHRTKRLYGDAVFACFATALFFGLPIFLGFLRSEGWF